MAYKLGRPMILTAAAALLSACVMDVGDDWDESKAVQTNARLAAEQCGAGGVKAVSADGFECKVVGEQ